MEANAIKGKREETLETLRETGVVAIIRGYGEDVCLHIAEACLAGGIRMVEVTFDQTRADGAERTARAIAAIGRAFGGRLSVGAGTVLTVGQLRMARDAGAAFAIAPNVDAEVIAAGVAEGLVSIPGAMTPSEVVAAWKAGADYVKLFPASQLGAGYVKTIRAPLAHIPLLAVGGVGADNAAAFLAAGCAGIGVGGPLTRREWIDSGAWDKIEENARAIVAAVEAGRAAR